MLIKTFQTDSSEVSLDHLDGVSWCFFSQRHSLIRWNPGSVDQKTQGFQSSLSLCEVDASLVNVLCDALKIAATLGSKTSSDWTSHGKECYDLTPIPSSKILGTFSKSSSDPNKDLRKSSFTLCE